MQYCGRTFIRGRKFSLLELGSMASGKPERNLTFEGKQIFISPYNKGHTLFIVPKLHTQQQSIF